MRRLQESYHSIMIPILGWWCPWASRLFNKYLCCSAVALGGIMALVQFHKPIWENDLGADLQDILEKYA